MFYSNNDGYMQDLYFYNQMPNSTYMNGFGNNMVGSPNLQLNQGNPGINSMMFQPQGFIPNTYSSTNLNNLYPSIYRIISPVISRVVSNNNQPITEEALNNMTDTVFNIVEGQIDFADDQIQKSSQPESQTAINTANANSQSRSQDPSRNSTNKLQSRSNSRNDYLLKDFIKTLIIKELLLKNQMQRQNPNVGMMQGYIPYNNFNF